MNEKAAAATGTMSPSLEALVSSQQRAAAVAAAFHERYAAAAVASAASGQSFKSI